MITLKEAKMAGDGLKVDWRKIPLREFRLGMNVEAMSHNFKIRGFRELGKLAFGRLNKQPNYYSVKMRKIKGE